MTIITEENDMIDEINLNKQEAVIFIKFLELEHKRHNEDISKISNTINYLKTKFKINSKPSDNSRTIQSAKKDYQCNKCKKFMTKEEGYQHIC